MKQSEVVEAVRDHPRVACYSSNAAGKSYTAARIAIAYLESHSPGYVVTTSSSWRGVDKVLWPEIRRALIYAPYQLGGTLLKTEWQRGPQWGAFGVSADVAENFAGFRTENGVLIIVDEASAIEQEIMDAINALAAGKDSRILLIGNPLRPSGPFYEACRSDNWHTLHISAMDTPNVAAGREVIPGLATREWVEDRKADWGENSPAYQARVLGEFPDMAEDTLIPLFWAEAAMERPIHWYKCTKCKYREVYGELSDGRECSECGATMEPIALDRSALHMGVDIARGGSDRTVLLIRDDVAVRHVETHLHKSLMDTAGRVQRLADDWGVSPERVHLDDCGLGGGVTDRLLELDFGVHAVNFGAKAHDSKRFANSRAESYWGLRDALDPTRHEIPLAIPREYSALAHECTIARLAYKSTGQIKLESKDDIKKRLGRSPDEADALALTYVAAPIVDVFIPGMRDKHEREPVAVAAGPEKQTDFSQMLEREEIWR